MENTLALLNGFGKGLGDGAVVSVISIILVFALLALIIAITYVISIVIGKCARKSTEEPEKSDTVNEPINIEDEDAKIAVIVASIDFRKATKKNIKVKSVKEI